MLRATLAVLLLAALLASATPVAAHAPPPRAPRDAGQVVEALGRHGLPIDGVLVHTAETDQDRLLGRPSGYLSKAQFRDARAPSPSAGGVAVEGGGAVEVFATAGQARARASFLRAMGQDVPALAEYALVHGTTLLRLSRGLTPTQVAEYRAALADLGG